MPFVRINLKKRLPQTGVRVGVRAGTGKNAAKVYLIFGSDALEAAGWKVGDKLAVEYGTGEDHGKVRVLADGSGYKLKNTRAKGTAGPLTLTVRVWDGLKVDRRNPTDCDWDFDADKGAVVVTLPSGMHKPGPMKFEDEAAAATADKRGRAPGRPAALTSSGSSLGS